MKKKSQTKNKKRLKNKTMKKKTEKKYSGLSHESKLTHAGIIC